MKNIEEALCKFLGLWLRSRMQQFDYPGISAAVWHKGSLIFADACGFADIGKGEKLTPGHLMRVASQSKTFTALGIMQLAEKGRLHPDDKAAKYLKFLNSADKTVQNITIRQLLSHAAGISRDTENADFWNLDEEFPDAEKLKSFFKKAGNVIDTNKQFKYSNCGFGLLGLIIEKVSGQSYAEYMDENIIRCCGLQKAYPDYASCLKKFAQGYSRRFPTGSREPLGFDSKTGALAPATGFCATPAEMCRLYRHLLPGEEKIISDEAKKEMFKPGFRIDDNDPRRYGLGFIEWQREWLGHSGNYIGFASATFFNPEKKIIISTAINAIDGEAVALTKNMINIVNFFSEHEKEILSSPFADYFYAFRSVWGIEVTVPCGNKIFVCNPDCTMPFDNAKILEPVDTDKFRVAKCGGFSNFGETVCFIRNAAGKIVKFKDGSTAETFEF